MIAALMAGSLFTTGTLSAQDAPKDAPKDKPAAAPGGPGGPGMRAGRPDFEKELSLTEDQKPKFKEIQKSAMEKMQALRNDTATSAEDKRAKRKTIQEDQTKAMKALLTEEQFPKWEKLSQGLRRGGPAAAPKTDAAPKADAKPDAKK